MSPHKLSSIVRLSDFSLCVFQVSKFFSKFPFAILQGSSELYRARICTRVLAFFLEMHLHFYFHQLRSNFSTYACHFNGTCTLSHVPRALHVALVLTAEMKENRAYYCPPCHKRLILDASHFTCSHHWEDESPKELNAKIVCGFRFVRWPSEMPREVD